MIQFHLNPSDLISRKVPVGLSVIETTDSRIIQESINNFNNEISWDAMFDLDECSIRFNSRDKMFIALYNKVLYGHCWLKKENEGYYIYNVFSKTNPTPRQYGATDMLYEVIVNHTSGSVRSEVDEWNEKSINVFMKLGFKII